MRTVWRNNFSRKIKAKFERSGNKIDSLCKIALCYDFSVGVRPNLLGGRDRGEIGAVAQLGERFNGIEEVEGSNPSSSTKYCFAWHYFTTASTFLLTKQRLAPYIEVI